MRRLLPGALVTTAVVTGVALFSVPSGAAPAVTTTALTEPVVVATGLNNPRQLSMSGTDLYVAEAGRGGTDCGEGDCVGTTGSIAKVTQAYRAKAVTPARVVTGLLSAAAPDGSFAVGPDGVSAAELGRLYIAMTYAPPDVLPEGLPGDQAGTLLLNRLGRTTTVADIAGVEIATDPDGQGVDSNPYAVLALPGRQLVADAAGNSIIEVRPGLAPRVFAVLPNHDCGQAVPTSLAVGRNGVIYVGELNSDNFGTARVDMLSPTGELIGHVDGFTTITGLAVGADGTLHVSELFGGDEGPVEAGATRTDARPCLAPSAGAQPARAARAARAARVQAARVRAARVQAVRAQVARAAAQRGATTQDLGLPGQVTTVRPDGTRSSRPVPLPAGLALDAGNHLYVSALSVFSGDDPYFGGQVWRLS